MEQMDISISSSIIDFSQSISDDQVNALMCRAFYDGPIGSAERRSFLHEWSRLLVRISTTLDIAQKVVRWLGNELDMDLVKVTASLVRNKEMTLSLFRILMYVADDHKLEHFTLVRSRLLNEDKRLDSSILTMLGQKKGSTKMDIDQPGEPIARFDADDSQTTNEILKILESLREGVPESDVAQVDRVLLLDPEIVRLTAWKQLEYLFSSHNSVGLRHLLSLLPHWGHVDTLRQVVEKLLSWQGKSYDCKKVLDFIAAVVKLPQLWAGREPKLPRHYEREDILHLTENQLGNLVYYVIKELSGMPITLPESQCHSTATSPVQTTSAVKSSRMEWTTHGPFASGTGVFSSVLEGRLQERVRLLLDCGQNHLEFMVTYLTNGSAANANEENVRKLLLLEFYFSRPEVSRFISDVSLMRDVRCLIHSNYTKMDAVLIRFFNSFAQAAANNEKEREMDQINTSLQEIANQHPTIMIRQMPLVAAQLRETTSFSLRKMDLTNYLQWYDMLLNLLDVLRPVVYDCHYVDAVADISNSFFDFIENNCLRSNRYVHLVDKTVKFVHHFYERQQDVASKFLQSRLPLLQAIATRFPEMPSIRKLLVEINVDFRLI